MAEVYWGLEWTLQQQGFDYTYDKRLYDRLHAGQARPVREHLMPSWSTRTSWRAFSKTTTSHGRRAAFSLEVQKAAAVITFLSPGLRFFHQGQCEGRKKRISPHLCRGPDEPIDQQLAQFYDRLLAVPGHPVVRQGNWQLLTCIPAWDGNWTWIVSRPLPGTVPVPSGCW